MLKFECKEGNPYKFKLYDEDDKEIKGLYPNSIDIKLRPEQMVQAEIVCEISLCDVEVLPEDVRIMFVVEGKPVTISVEEYKEVLRRRKENDSTRLDSKA